MLRSMTKLPMTLAACLTLTLMGSCGPDKPADAGDAGAPPAQQAAAPASNKPAVAGVYKLDMRALTLKGDTLTLVEGAGTSAMTLVFRKKAPK